MLTANTADEAAVTELPDGILDHLALVEQDLKASAALRQQRLVLVDPGQLGAGRGGDLDGIGLALLEDLQDRGRGAVEPAPPVGRRHVVAHPRHLAEGQAVGSHRQTLDLLKPAEASHRPHQELLRAVADVPRGDREVGVPQVARQIAYAQAVGLKGVAVGLDEDLLLVDAFEIDLGHARQSLQPAGDLVLQHPVRVLQGVRKGDPHLEGSVTAGVEAAESDALHLLGPHRRLEPFHAVDDLVVGLLHVDRRAELAPATPTVTRGAAVHLLDAADGEQGVFERQDDLLLDLGGVGRRVRNPDVDEGRIVAGRKELDGQPDEGHGPEHH
jgi:hypothetical protein